MQTEITYRVVKAYCTPPTITPNQKLVHLLSSQEYPDEITANDELNKFIESNLTALNADTPYEFGEPAWDAICEPKDKDSIMLRRRRSVRSYNINAYFGIYPLQAESVIIDPAKPDQYKQWKYRNYWISKNDKNNRFTIRFIDMRIGVRHSLKAALNFIDEHLTEEKIHQNGRIYYAG